MMTSPLRLDEFSIAGLAKPFPGFERAHRIGAIKVRSADEASEMRPTAGARNYVIRLIDPHPSALHPYPPLAAGHAWVREYFFDDILPGAPGVLFSVQLAESILADLDEALRDSPIDLLLVHCFAGASRSPALAGALARIYGALSVPEFASDAFWQAQIRPNAHVFDTMIAAALRRAVS